MGEGPRHFGRREGWTLITPFSGISRISFGRITPNDATTNMSHFFSLNAALHASSRMDSGESTGMCFASAHSLTGVPDTLSPLPFGRSGAVTISCGRIPASLSSSRTIVENRDEPKKANEIIVLLMIQSEPLRHLPLYP